MQEFKASDNATSSAGPCPWHQFLARVSADQASLLNAFSDLKQQMLDRPRLTTCLAAILIPLTIMMMQRRGRRILFEAADTTVATVLLLLLLLAVLGLPAAAAYLFWFTIRTIATYFLALL